jgi:hypothetical protein
MTWQESQGSGENKSAGKKKKTGEISSFTYDKPTEPGEKKGMTT